MFSGRYSFLPQISSLRALPLDARSHFGVDAVSKAETLSVLEYSQLLAPLKSLAIHFLGTFLPVLSSHAFMHRRDLVTAVLECLSYAV